MNAPRRKTPFLILILFILLLSAASSPNPQARWRIESIDAPMLLENLTPGMLKVVDGTPYLAVGGDHLYYFQMDPGTSIWSYTRLDENPGVGSYASLAKDIYGRTFISYYDSINQSLKFATPNPLYIGRWTIQTVDGTSDSGKGSAIAVVTGGQPHISYLTNSTLKHIWRTCTGSIPHEICTWNTPEQVDIDASIDTGTSIALSSTDIPHISYVDASGQLKHAYKIGGGIGNCGNDYNWQCDVIPDVPALAYYHTPSIALYNDLPRIAFYDSYAGLNFAYKDGTGWHVSVVHSGSSYGYHPSLMLDASGRPYISYTDTNGYVRHAWGSSTTGGSWTLETTAYDGGGQTSIAYNTSPSAYPCILYYEQTYGQLRYTCKLTSWTDPQMLTISMDVGRDTSLALDMAGVPHIAYADRLSSIGFPQVATWSQTPGGCYLYDATDQWKCEEVNGLDSNAGSGYMNSIAINPLTGSPAVSYLDRTGVNALGYAWYVGSGGNCTGNDAWNCTKIDSVEMYMPGYEPSLIFDSSGTPVIAYMTGDANPSLKLARKDGNGTGNCNANADWNCQVVDGALGPYGGQPSLALTTTGKAVISYNHSNYHSLRLALQVTSSGTGCNNTTHPGTWNCIDIDPDIVAGFARSSLVLLSDTEARISYYFNSMSALKFASVTLPSGISTLKVIDWDYSGYFNSQALYQGIPWIAYSKQTGNNYSLRLTHWVGESNGNCGAVNDWQCEVLDDVGSLGAYPSLKINSSGMAYISYYDDANGDLKLAYTRLFSFMPLLKKP